MTETFGYDPKLHDALVWSAVMPDGKRLDRSFESEDAAWRAFPAARSVVPIAWSYKKVVDSSLPV